MSVNTSQSVSNFTKLNNAFKAYNGNLTKSTQLQTAYIKAVGNQNSSLGNYLAGLNGAKASMGGYIKSLIGAKAATIGLQVASTLLNTAISMGLSLAINALVSAISNWINREKEAREEAIENAKAAKEESNNLTELLNKYNQLSKEVQSNQGVKEDLLEVQSDLLEALGIEASQIDSLIEKYGDLDSAINQVTLDSLRDAQGDLMTAVDAYEGDLIDIGKGYAHWYSLFDRNILSGGQDSVQAFNILENAGVISSGSHGTGGGSLVLTGDDKTVEGILENYQKLKDAQEALNTAIDNGEVTMEEMAANPLYQAINKRLDELDESIGNYNTAVDDLNKNIAQQQILKSLSEQSSIPETQEEFETFKQSMIDTAIASTKFVGSQDDIRDSIINVLSTMPEFEKFFEEIKVKSDTFNNETTISFSYDKLENISEKLSEIENAYKTAKEALQSYNKNGYYSMEAIDSILSLEDEYINILVDENGQLQLNNSSMNQLAAIKIETAKASIYQETCEELVRIKTLDTALAAQELALTNGTLTESAYETAKALYEEVTAMGDAKASLANTVWDAATKKVKLLDNQLANLNSGTYNVAKSTASSSKSAADKAKEYVEAYIELQKQSLESGRIDYQNYSRDVERFLKDMFDQGKISAKDYHDYTKQVLEEQKSIMDNALSAITNRLDKEINKYEDLIEEIEKANDALEEQKTSMENAAEAVVDYIDSLIDGENDAIDALNQANDGIQEQIEKYDSLINVADRLYEEEQERLKSEQDAIQDKIDLIQDENDAYDLQYRKEMALYELQRSQQQRTKKLYVGDKGYIYDTDKTAISEAKEKLQDIETEELISSLEKEKDALNESIDALQEYRDALSEISDSHNKLIDERNTIELIGSNYEKIILGTNIDDWILLKDKYISANDEMADNEDLIKSHEEKIEIWEDEKDNWSSLSSAIDDEAKKQAASQQFGADWESQVLNGRLQSFESFKSEYLNIESQINDNTSLINSYNEKITYYEDLKEQWNDISSAAELAFNEQCAAQLLGADWESKVLNGRLDTLNGFKKQYMKIQQSIADAAWNSANEQVKAAKEAQKGADGNIGSSGSIGSDDDISKADKGKWYIVKSQTGEVVDPKWYEEPIDAMEQLKKLNKNGGGYTLKKYHRGLEEGIVGDKLTDKESFDELLKHGLKKNEVPSVLQNGEVVLTKIQRWNIASDLKMLDNLIQAPKLNILDRSYLNNIASRNNSVPLSINIGDIYLHEVQNVEDLGQQIVKRLPNAMLQAINKR